MYILSTDSKEFIAISSGTISSISFDIQKEFNNNFKRTPDFERFEALLAWQTSDIYNLWQYKDKPEYDTKKIDAFNNWCNENGIPQQKIESISESEEFGVLEIKFLDKGVKFKVLNPHTAEIENLINQLIEGWSETGIIKIHYFKS